MRPLRSGGMHTSSVIDAKGDLAPLMAHGGACLEPQGLQADTGQGFVLFRRQATHPDTA